MGWVDYLKNYFKKSSANPTNSTAPNSVEDWILKSEIDPNDITNALVHVRCTDGTTMIYSIPRHTISERIIRERKEREAYSI